ncbi:hypothetical protein FHR47_000922 [Xanthomonas arboricola]|nr:hypothetical protein [Xanthomonas cannabis]
MNYAQRLRNVGLDCPAAAEGRCASSDSKLNGCHIPEGCLKINPGFTEMSPVGNFLVKQRFRAGYRRANSCKRRHYCQSSSAVGRPGAIAVASRSFLSRGMCGFTAGRRASVATGDQRGTAYAAADLRCSVGWPLWLITDGVTVGRNQQLQDGCCAQGRRCAGQAEWIEGIGMSQRRGSHAPEPTTRANASAPVADALPAAVRML